MILIGFDREDCQGSVFGRAVLLKLWGHCFISGAAYMEKKTGVVCSLQLGTQLNRVRPPALQAMGVCRGVRGPLTGV